VTEKIPTECPTCGCPNSCAEAQNEALRGVLRMARRIIDPNEADVLEEIDMALALGQERS
jgi:hypothetical protein